MFSPVKNIAEASRIMTPGRGIGIEEVDIMEAEEISSESSRLTEVDGEAFVKDVLNKPDRMSMVVHDKALLKRQHDARKRKRNSTRLRQKEVEWLRKLMFQREYNKSKSSMANPTSDYFDPVGYMSKKPLICRKYHYSVPMTYDDSYTLLKFDSVANAI